MAIAFSQSDRGTITGTVSDASGAVVPGAQISLTNVETGSHFQTVTTETGNYTLPSLPNGVYTMTIEQKGFSKYSQVNIRVQVAQTARIDAVLQVGQASEAVEVTAEVGLLKTENAEQSMTISGERIASLPLNFSLGAGAIRNPLAFATLNPGSRISGWNDIRINGAPSATFRVILEGQDQTTSLNPRVTDESQPSTEALQEFTLQTSNYAAEYGQVGGGLFNFSSKSGTNQLHGSVYEYFTNEDLNAGQPDTTSGNGHHLRPRARRHDYGGSIGGPVFIPKIYNGKDKTFFFFNMEFYKDKRSVYFGALTVPTTLMRTGNFSQILSGRNFGTDGLGRAILENTIYDPTTARTVSGAIYTDPFPGNIIPQARFDATAGKIQALIPTPVNGNLVNNYTSNVPFQKIQDIPSVKIDHNFTGSAKFSAYWSMQKTDKDNSQDGFPDPISGRQFQLIRSYTYRANYDLSLSPTLLFHAGVGYQRYHNPGQPPPQNLTYNAASQLGISGVASTGFPRIIGLSNTTFGGYSGSMGPGAGQYSLYLQDRPTASLMFTWVHGNHTYKTGAEFKRDTFTNISGYGTSGVWTFAVAETSQPALQSTSLPGSVGFPYASFLLGGPDAVQLNNVTDPQFRRKNWGFYVQDTWKVTKKLTFDYGVRWDVLAPFDEMHQRLSQFSANTANPAAGGRPGAIAYEGSGPGRCNCQFTKTYPYGIGPRLGVAFQLTPKTVLRAGWALTYAQPMQFDYATALLSQGMGYNSLQFSAPSYGTPPFKMSQGLAPFYTNAQLYGAGYDPGMLISPNAINNAPYVIDPNAGRPGRLNQWSIGVQRQILSDLAIEAAYIGNRGAWFDVNSYNFVNSAPATYNLIDYNALTPEMLKSRGLDTTNAADRTLLTSLIGSTLAASRGFTKPYANFPNGGTVAQSLRPYPQFNAIGTMWAPVGNSWYDALQMKLTKRFSHGFDGTFAYTRSKNLTTDEDASYGTSVPTNNVYNRALAKTISNVDLPNVMVIGFNYRVPAIGILGSNRILKTLLADWQIGGILRYSSGLPIASPRSNNALASLVFQSTVQNRVPGQALWSVDPNCHSCWDPNKQFLLNPAAWSDAPAGTWGSAAAYYNDYRGQRHPDESANIGKRFMLRKEGRMSFQLRAELFNPFNRLVYGNPTATNPQATQTRNAAGAPSGGFGFLNTAALGSYRTGQLVARFEF